MIDCGHPYELLHDEQSILHQMVTKLDKQEKDRLYQIAKLSFDGLKTKVTRESLVDCSDSDENDNINRKLL